MQTINLDLQLMQNELLARLQEAGASLVGFADLAPLPLQATSGLRFGISVAIALDPNYARAIARDAHLAPLRADPASGARVAALAAAPPEDPPGVRAGSQGLLVVP